MDAGTLSLVLSIIALTVWLGVLFFIFRRRARASRQTLDLRNIDSFDIRRPSRSVAQEPRESK